MTNIIIATGFTGMLFTQYAGLRCLLLILGGCLAFSSMVYGQLAPVSITIKVRGVYQTNVSLMHFKNGDFRDNERYRYSLRNGDSITIVLDSADYPAELMLRYDYRLTPQDRVTSIEQNIFIGRQSLRFSVNPPFCNNEDSVQFELGEQENNLWRHFNAGRGQQLKQLVLLETLLMDYDDKQAPLMTMAGNEYKKRRQLYETWLQELKNKCSGCFVSSLLQFSHLPWPQVTGSSMQQRRSVLDNYTAGIQLSDPVLTRSAELTQWLTAYVNKSASLGATQPEQDSLLRKAAISMIETAKKGHPEVYGFVVDYFLDGFKQNGISETAALLAPYLNDSACLTSERKAMIKKRLAGPLIPVGSVVGPVLLETAGGESKLLTFGPQQAKKPTLLVFYNSECDHCTQLLQELREWYSLAGTRETVDIVTAAIDANKQQWKQYADTAKHPWLNGYATGGILGKTAKDYKVENVPTLFLIDKDGKLQSSPAKLDEVKAALKNMKSETTGGWRKFNPG